nr:hypothetical protein [uncultured Draconibacterium sp.]
MKKLISFLILVSFVQFGSYADLTFQEESSVYGEYKLTVFNSLRGDIKVTLKIWKDEQGRDKAQFTEEGEVMEVQEIDISGNKLVLGRYPYDYVNNVEMAEATEAEEWILKVEKNKIRGTLNHDFSVSGYRVEGSQ